MEDALAGGEEYELLVPMPADAALDVEAFRARFGIALTRIGHVAAGHGVSLEGNDDRVDRPSGHDHLS